MLKQSFSWDGFVRTGIAPDVLARGAAEIGYDAVEMVPQADWSTVLDAGMRILTMTAHPLAPEGLNSRVHFPALSQVIRANIDLAAANSIPMLLVFSGWRNGLDAVTGADVTVEHLSLLADVARDAGMTLLLELLSTTPARDYMADSTAWGADVVRRVGSPHVKLLYDIFHMQIMEGDIIRTIQANLDVIGHIHTAGNPGRHDLNDEQELYYPAIVRAIAAAGYTGHIGHEFFPKGEALAALKHAYDLVNAAS